MQKAILNALLSTKKTSICILVICGIFGVCFGCAAYRPDGNSKLQEASDLEVVTTISGMFTITVPKYYLLEQSCPVDTLYINFLEPTTSFLKPSTNRCVMKAYGMGWIRQDFFHGLPEKSKPKYITVNGCAGVSVEVALRGELYSRKAAFEIPTLPGPPFSVSFEYENASKQDKEIADRIIASITPKSGAKYPDDWKQFRIEK